MPDSEVKRSKKLPIIEMFGPTMQGEGIVAGTRTIFIRFGLCDYKCTMCDSMHAVDPIRVKQNAKWLDQEEIAELALAQLQETKCNSITYSGGNPCIHDLTYLTEALFAEGVSIAVETQGTFAPEWLKLCRYITISPKGPGMGEIFEPSKFIKFFDTFQGSNNHDICVKVVIFSAQDLEFAAAVHELVPNWVKDRRWRRDNFYLSIGNPNPPGSKYLVRESSVKEDIITSLEHTLDDLKSYPQLQEARILPQVHVLVWGNKQGV